MQRTHTPPPGTAPGTAPGAVPAAVADAAGGYWHRRGLPTAPGQVVAAPTAPLLLLALLAAACGDDASAGVVLPRPGAAWHAEQVRLLGRPLHPVPVPAECGGVPDPFALLEAVGRARAAGGDPRVLLLSVADDVTGTTAPPELLSEVCEAAAQEGLMIVSDETWRDTVHDPQDTVLVGPAEILHCAGRAADAGTHPGDVRGTGPRTPAAPARAAEETHAVVVLTAEAAGPASARGPGFGAGVARLPAGRRGRELGERTRAALAALHARLDGP
ncbi:aminotransferase class I/II-fold pyridoxal phosphate-dependent enzyme, partial [Streptomyces glaucosporus]|uniref:aminotransferase class I/II-fold pyridoxal phosphate-dependent enzyme n=1 Tax=Streptomyces glaucosporus TaxID=284044 RepID=UPI0031CE8079